MRYQDENLLENDQCVEDDIDDDTFIEWKNQLEKTIPSFWESIHESESVTKNFDRDEQSFICSINALFSRKHEIIKSWVPYHDDGFFKFNFLK